MNLETAHDLEIGGKVRSSLFVAFPERFPLHMGHFLERETLEEAYQERYVTLLT